MEENKKEVKNYTTGTISLYDIDSSNIDNISYNTNKMELTLEFINSKGIVYVYSDVPLYEIYGFIEAESPGAYFNNNIKKKYNFIKITGN